MKSNMVFIYIVLAFFVQNAAANETLDDAIVFSKLMFGGFDKHHHGSVWRTHSTPPGFENWRNKEVISKQLIFKKDFCSKSIVVIFYTGIIPNDTHANLECHSCKSLISAGVFRNKNGRWRLVHKNIFLKSDGSWGSPPDIEFVSYQSDSEFSLLFSGVDTSTGSSTTWSYKINFFKNKWEETDNKEETINMENLIESQDPAVDDDLDTDIPGQTPRQ